MMMMSGSTNYNVSRLMETLWVTAAICLIRHIVQKVTIELNKRITPFEYEVDVCTELFAVGTRRICLLSRTGIAKAT